jgi:aminoglycoside phosphotransferase (APT) family kinase protein
MVCRCAAKSSTSTSTCWRPTRRKRGDALDRLGSLVPRRAALALWDDALRATWRGRPVWFHGDVAAGNLIVRDGELAAVIDFGSSGVGDPACDVVIAWTLLSKALVTLAGSLGEYAAAAAHARHVIDQVLADHAGETRS